MENALITTTYGQLFLVNLYDAIDKQLIDSMSAKMMLAELRDIYNRTNLRADKSDRVKESLDDLSSQNKCGIKYESKYNPGTDESEFYFNISQKQYIASIIDHKADLTNNYRSNVDSSMIAENSEFTLRHSGHLGYIGENGENGRVWLTDEDSLYIKGDLQDSISRLGLIHHYKRDNDLVILKIPKLALESLYRPIVTDAGSHLRFKQTKENDVEDDIKLKRWGETHCIHNAMNNEENKDGCNEAVSLPISLDHLSEEVVIEGYDLGTSQKDEAIYNDEQHDLFVKSLLDNRDPSILLDEIMK